MSKLKTNVPPGNLVETKMTARITEQLDGLTKELVTIHEVITVLETKFSEALIPPGQAITAIAGEQPQYGSPMGDYVRKISGEVEKARVRLTDLCDRCHL